MNRWGLIVGFLVFIMTGITSFATASIHSNSNSKMSSFPKVLVVSLDGFRYNYPKMTSTPHLNKILSEGVTVPWMQSQFPTSTFPNHQSIATGLYPDSHGVTDNVVYDPEYQTKLNGYEPASHEFWNFDPSVLPLYTLNELAGKGRHSGCFMWPGYYPRLVAADGNKTTSTYHPSFWERPEYFESVPWSVKVDKIISWLTDSKKPVNLAFLYYSEPDSQQHRDGPEDKETLRVVREIDRRIGELVRKLKNADIYDAINLIIISDHGMKTVSDNKVIDTRKMADSSLYTTVIGLSSSRQLWPKSGVSVEDLYLKFKEGVRSNGNFQVFRKEEMGFLNYTTNRRIAPLILLANPGYVFEDLTGCYFNYRRVCGMHGYDPRSPEMHAFFAARGPNFKKGFVSTSPIQNVDLFPMISSIIGIPLAPNNGSLAHTIHLLEETGPTRISQDFVEDPSQSLQDEPNRAVPGVTLSIFLIAIGLESHLIMGIVLH